MNVNKIARKLREVIDTRTEEFGRDSTNITGFKIKDASIQVDFSDSYINSTAICLIQSVLAQFCGVTYWITSRDDKLVVMIC